MVDIYCLSINFQKDTLFKFGAGSIDTIQLTRLIEVHTGKCLLKMSMQNMTNEPDDRLGH
jgi:hypothetical protein